MATEYRRVRIALQWHRRVAGVFAAVGLGLVVSGVVVGLTVAYATGLVAMGVLLLVATVPLFARASTLRRQLTQIEISWARQQHASAELPRADFVDLPAQAAPSAVS